MGEPGSDLGSLRALLDREQAFFQIEHQQSRIFERTSFESIKSLIFATRKVFSLHLSIIEHARTNTPIDALDLATAPPLVFAASYSSTSKPFQPEVAPFLSNLKPLADKLSDFIVQNPTSENWVVFSLLPAFFSCLWSVEETDVFIDFFLCLQPQFHRSVSRLLLVHPSTFVYLSAIRSGLVNLADTSLHEILDLFTQRGFLLPFAFRRLLADLPNPTQFLIECVLTPLLKDPSLYGLLPATDTRTFENLYTAIDRAAVDRFLEAARAIPPGIQMQPTQGSLRTVLSAHEQQIYLFRQDCLIVRQLTASSIDVPDQEGFCAVPFKRKGQKADLIRPAESIVEEDPFETLLRNLVLQLDVHPHPTILDTLNSALMIYSGRSRLQVELSLDDFRQMKKQRNAPDDLSYYIQLLTAAYENRMKHRTDTLSNWTISNVFNVQRLQSSQAAQFVTTKRQMMFFTRWATFEGPFAGIEAKVPEFCRNPATFKSEYKSLLSQFQQYSDSLKLGLTLGQYCPIVYNRLTEMMTLTKFRESDPELVRKDERIHEMIEKDREELYARNAQTFLQAFKDNPELMGLSASHLRKAFSRETPIAIARYIDRALTAMIHLLSFQGYKEIGADHWLPITLMLFIHVNPPRIASVRQYMHNFLLTLSDGNPVSQSQEYNVTMADSAGAYFTHELQKWEKEQEDAGKVEGA
jgi:hypothetical protein